MPAGWLGRGGVLAMALLGGAAIFFFGSPYYDVFPTNDSEPYNAMLVVGFGLLTLGLYRRAGLASYAPSAYALFVAAAVNLVLVVGPFNRLVTAEPEYKLATQDKVAQFLSVVPVILVLTWAGRRGWGWVYLERGQLRRWVPFGLLSFAVCAIAVTLAAIGSGATRSELRTVTPWLMVFVVANGIMEELWFRGIFLRPYAANLGGPSAVVVTALVFGASHLNATYISAGQQVLFAATLFGLGLALAWAIRWGDSVWGAVLLHMGLDLTVVLQLLKSA